MNFMAFGLTALIGLFLWGGWPVLAQSSKNLTDPVVRAFLVNVVTVIGLVPFLPGRLTMGMMTSRDAIILVAAGLLNFGGHFLFPSLQTAGGSQVSLFMTLIPAMCIVASNAGGALFYGDSMPPAKIFFVGLIIVGIIGLAVISVR